MAPISYDQLSMARKAKLLVDEVLGRVPAADQDKVRAALVAAAGQSGNRYLSIAEVKGVLDAFGSAPQQGDAGPAPANEPAKATAAAVPAPQQGGAEPAPANEPEKATAGAATPASPVAAKRTQDIGAATPASPVGARHTQGIGAAAPALPVAARGTPGFDVNGFGAADQDRLAARVGLKVASAIAVERNRSGRFGSLEELKQRVQQVAALPEAQLAALGAAMKFGSGQVNINTATSEELMRAGFAQSQARAIVAHREANGAFASVDALANVPGLTRATLASCRKRLTPADE